MTKDYPAKRLKSVEKPKLCVECYINYALPPYKRCNFCLEELQKEKEEEK